MPSRVADTRVGDGWVIEVVLDEIVVRDLERGLERADVLVEVREGTRAPRFDVEVGPDPHVLTFPDDGRQRGVVGTPAQAEGCDK